MIDMTTTAPLTPAALATELGTDPKTCRAFLRSITPRDEQPGKGGRWALKGTKTEIAKFRKQFTAWTAEQDAKRLARAEAKAAASQALQDAADAPEDAVDEAPTDAELDALAEAIMTDAPIGD